MRRIAAFLIFIGVVPVSAQTQDAQTLADIRTELEALSAEIGALRQELVVVNPATTGIADPAPLLQRLNTLEAEMVRITGDVEELKLEIERIVRDGTNRVDDLTFRLTELEGGDIAALPETPPLGTQTPSAGQGETGGGIGTLRPRLRDGEPVATLPPVTTPPPTEELPQPGTPTETADPGEQPLLAMNEQADFDAAFSAFEQGNFAEADRLFTSFLANYPGGPLNGEAGYWRGEALYAQGRWTEAARAYLDSFSGAPQGERAPASLYRLGASLGNLGQRDEACLTLNEVFKRYPTVAPDIAAGVTAELQTLNCS